MADTKPAPEILVPVDAQPAEHEKTYGRECARCGERLVRQFKGSWHYGQKTALWECESPGCYVREVTTSPECLRQAISQVVTNPDMDDDFLSSQEREAAMMARHLRDIQAD